MTVYPSTTVLMMVYAGRAANPELGPDAPGYELLQSLTGEMIVESLTTRKKVCLSWQDLLQLAVAAGIDTPNDPPDTSDTVAEVRQVALVLSQCEEQPKTN